jgi:hypothetical protein
MGSGGRGAKFEKHGDRVWGVIMDSQMRQQIDLDTGKPAVWDDGNPKMQLVVTLLTEQQDDDDDDGLRKVYIRGQMQKSIAEAVRKVGAKGLRDGGKLIIEYTGDAAPTRKGFSGAKQYFAKYAPPVQEVVAPEESEPDDIPF